MGDDDAFMEEDVAAGGDLEVGQKVGFLPAMIIRILTWVAISLAIIIVMAVVSFFVFRAMSGNRAATLPPAASEEYLDKTPILDYDDLEEIRGRTSDVPSQTFISVISLGFDPDDRALASELGNRKRELRHEIRQLMASKTASQLMNEDPLLKEILDQVNRIMSSGRIQKAILLEHQVF
jgi:flagellar FliL protein